MFIARSITVTGNIASTGLGGGIYCGKKATLNLTDANFSSNCGQQGGGVALSTAGTVSMRRCTFDSNHGTDGGGIYSSNMIESAWVTITGCKFTKNAAGECRRAEATTSPGLEWSQLQGRQINCRLNDFAFSFVSSDTDNHRLQGSVDSN